MLKPIVLIKMVGKTEKQNLKLVGNVVHKNKSSSESKNYDLTFCRLKLSPIVGGVNSESWDFVTCEECLNYKPKNAT